MVSLEEQEKVVFFNSQYQDNSELINRLQEKLLRDINSLNLSKMDLLDTKEYLQDKVTLFRFLRETKFDFDKAHEQLLETIRWRMEIGIADLTWESSIEFFANTDQGAFAFYHKTDKTDCPLIHVRLRLFPTDYRDKTQRLLDHIQRFACLMLEIGRKLTWEMTCERTKRNEPCVLVSQMTVVVNIQKAPMIPIDAELIRTLSMILDTKFPGIVGTVNVLNFGWVYQGIWSVVKYLLSEEAKQSLKFTTVNELRPAINPDSILKEMGGNDDYQWSFESDEALQKYGTGMPSFKAEEPPVTPPISEDRSRSNSIMSSTEELEQEEEEEEEEEEQDEFFDAKDSLPSIPITLPITTETLLQEQLIIPQPTTAITTTKSPTHLPGTLNYNTNSYYGNLSTWAGLRMGVGFLTSFIDTKQGLHQKQITPISTLSNTTSNNDIDELLLPSTLSKPSEDIILVNPSIETSTTTTATAATSDIIHPPLNNTIISITGYNLKRLELYFKKLTHQLLHLSFGQRGMIYWVLLYVFLRGPVESLVKRSLVRISIVGPQRIATATIGLTAAMAAVVGTSFSSSIEKRYTHNNKRIPPPL